MHILPWVLRLVVFGFSGTMNLALVKSQPDQAGDALLPQAGLGSYEGSPFHSSPQPRDLRAYRSRNSFQQLLSSWLCFAATVLFLVLTALYAAQIPLSSKFTFVYDSSSNTIFVLSLLSGISGLLLTAVLGIAFENLQWLLLARRRGMRATDFLALHPGTGVQGLLSL